MFGFSKTIRSEVIVLSGILLLFLAFFVVAVVAARAEIRDDLRIQDSTNLKRALEQYNNQYQHYATPPHPSPGCTSSSDTSSWFFGAHSPLLTAHVLDALPHDLREGQGFDYRYCVTDISSGVAQGYYLEARLERTRPEGVNFDEDETRKFHYRILHSNGEILYRVCGGTEQQCIQYE